jgi:tetratricopeptide (TPR) repeat protein
MEYDNLLATLDTLTTDSERTADVLELGVALVRFVMTRFNSTLPHYLHEALSNDTEVPLSLRARALMALSWMTATTGSQERSHQLASDLSEQAFSLAEQIGDDDLTCQALNLRSFTWRDLGRPELGIECANAALDLARRLNSPRRIAEALGGLIYAIASPPETRDEITEALALSRQLNDAYWVTHFLVFNSLALTDTLEDVRESRALNSEAMEVAEEIGSTFHRLILWSNAGSFSFFLGEIDVALQYSRQALRLSRRSGRSVGHEYWMLFTLACCATQQGDFLVGAQLTGAHDGIEERALEPLGGYWSPLEIAARENNRVTLREALGNEEYDRLIAVGKGLSVDRVYDLALGRTSHAE